ncbi:MAG: signal peptidase I [Planctomycetes bacterium]|nr:signal peptidase I [Planctomycetota bacterium]MCW8134919.1 signal peptidase I [Planctomycetota bacterium]
MALIAQQRKDSEPDPRVKGFKRWVKRLRVALALVLVLLAVYVLLSYSVFTVPGTFDPESKRITSPINDVQQGDTLLLLKLNLWREPRLGDIVFYEHPDPRDDAPETLLGRIAGLPGEKVTAQLPTFSVGGREPLGIGWVMGAQAGIKDGDVIPDGHYLIVTDNDAVAYGDSRDFGYVPQEKITQRVALNLAGVFGQRKVE